MNTDYLILEAMNSGDVHSILHNLQKLNSNVANDDDDEESQPLKLTIVDRLQIGLDVARAMSFVHLKKYLHCDIHPGNILVSLLS